MILIVGNVLKDVYLNLDSRTESFEIDGDGVKWLDFGFDTSSHHYFSRNSSFGGAAVSLEVLKKLGIDAEINNSNFVFGEESSSFQVSDYRYILTSEDNVSYLVPTLPSSANFYPPEKDPEYLYIDKSAHLSLDVAEKIEFYLSERKNTKLILYLKDTSSPAYNKLIKLAHLIITEDTSAELDYDRTIFISDHDLSYKNIVEPITVERIDKLTHLSAYSIAAATIIGNFLLGENVENSLKMARLNVENSNLNSTLSLSELNALQKTGDESLDLIAAALMADKKGILAMDESEETIKKRFSDLNIDNTFENRHDYRELLLSTPDIENYLNGIILFDETAHDHMDTGESVPDYIISKRIIPGIKIGQDLNDLEKRLREYREMGLRFAKRRAAFSIEPSEKDISESCRDLAEYAKACQSAGMVPIIEPEVLYDGNYSIEENARTAGKIFDILFKELRNYNVNLSICIIKCNMILAGKRYYSESSPEEVGKITAEVLKTHIPAEVAGIAFLSGGQSPEQATENLAAIVKNGPFPWPITFSFSRALQEPVLSTWAGDNDNIKKAQKVFGKLLQKNTEIL